MSRKFTAQLQAFADLTERQMKAVVADSFMDVLQAAQTPQPSVKITGGAFEIGKIPVDEGDLIQSLQVGINMAYAATGGAATMALTDWSIGDTLSARWTAAHALPMELGFTTRNGGSVPGRHFVGTNAARWSEFVAANAAKRKV